MRPRAGVLEDRVSEPRRWSLLPTVSRGADLIRLRWSRRRVILAPGPAKSPAPARVRRPESLLPGADGRPHSGGAGGGCRRGNFLGQRPGHGGVGRVNDRLTALRVIGAPRDGTNKAVAFQDKNANVLGRLPKSRKASSPRRRRRSTR